MRSWILMIGFAFLVFGFIANLILSLLAFGQPSGDILFYAVLFSFTPALCYSILSRLKPDQRLPRFQKLLRKSPPLWVYLLYLVYVTFWIALSVEPIYMTLVIILSLVVMITTLRPYVVQQQEPNANIPGPRNMTSRSGQLLRTHVGEKNRIRQH